VGRAVFDPFLRGWFDAHAFRSVGTADFVDYLRTTLLRTHPEAMPEAELAQWLHEPGLPASAREAQSQRLAAIDAVFEAWRAGKLVPDAFGSQTWSTQEWQHFLNAVGEKPSVDQLAQLDAAFKLSAARNNEIAFRWFMAAVRADYQPAFAPLGEFLCSVGRRKFVKPLFEELAKTPAHKQWATTLYTRARAGYHPVTQAAVDAALGTKG
jgi:hypothetical protein